jgi:SAM-dependent methyltransferase
VLAGNAMHWFDMNVAGPEIARVLEPDGILAGLWNVFDNRVDWVAGLERISGKAAIGPSELEIEPIEQIESRDRFVLVFFQRGRHAGPFETPLRVACPDWTHV